MADRPASKVDDWVTVSPNDWETVTDWESVPSPQSGRPASEAFKQPEGSAMSRIGGVLGDTAKGVWNAGKMALDLASTAGLAAGGRFQMPSQETQDALSGIVEGHKDQWRKANETSGSESFGHRAAAMLPVVGPAAAHAAERIGGSAPKLDKYGNVIEQGAAPDIAGGVTEGVVLAASSSPKNVVRPAATAVAKGLARIPVPERLTPEGLYQSSLRPSLAKKNLPKVEKQVATGLRENIPVSKGGLAKARTTIDTLNEEIADRLRGKSDELGEVVSPSEVVKRTASVPEEFDTVNPEADLRAIERSRGEFLRKHQTERPYTKIRPMDTEEGSGYVSEGQGVVKTEKPLTLSEAQAEKQRTYGQLRKKYGELSSAEVETQKNLARGLKEEIVKRVPELAGLNAREGALIELEGQLEKMIAREGNKNVLGLVPATMAHNPFGFLATLVMDNPAIKSRIAIALDRVRRVTPSATQMGGAAAVAVPAGMVGRPPATLPPPLSRRPPALMPPDERR